MANLNTLKQLRKMFGLTQEQAAQMSGVTRSAWRFYEESDLKSSTIKKLTSTFKVSSDYIIGLTDDPRPVNAILSELEDTKKELVALKAKLQSLENK